MASCPSHLHVADYPPIAVLSGRLRGKSASRSCRVGAFQRPGITVQVPPEAVIDLSGDPQPIRVKAGIHNGDDHHDEHLHPGTLRFRASPDSGPCSNSGRTSKMQRRIARPPWCDTRRSCRVRRPGPLAAVEGFDDELDEEPVGVRVACSSYTGRGQVFRRAVMDRRGGGREQPRWEETHRLRAPNSAAERTTPQPDGTSTAPGRQRSSATRGCAVRTLARISHEVASRSRGQLVGYPTTVEYRQEGERVQG